MKFWVGVTDNNWFEFLSTKNFDEVNFWQPSAIPLFKKLHPGTPFLFKLKKPFNHIAGGGYFVKYSTLPISLAWDAFGEKNGANSINELERLIKPLASDQKIGLARLDARSYLARSSSLPMNGFQPQRIGHPTLYVEKRMIPSNKMERYFGTPFKIGSHCLNKPYYLEFKKAPPSMEKRS